MTSDPRPETLAFLEQYNPAKAPQCYVSPAQWTEIRPVVLEGVSPLAHLARPTLRPFLTALTHLALFGQQHGYELDIKVLLDPVLVEAFLGNVRKETKDPAPYLWRLSDRWGLVGTGDSHAGLMQPDYRAPYSHTEMTALLLAAHNQCSTHRTATLLAIIFLGAGCGVNRGPAAGVMARDVHQHGDAWFVRTPKYCARVREEFLPLYYEVAELRPTGRLRGTRSHDSVTVAASAWLHGRRGVPSLSVDRLRATYVCELLNDGTSVLDTLAWSGLQGAESLNGYLAYVSRPPFHCATSNQGAK